MNAAVIINYVTSVLTFFIGIILVSGYFSQLKNNTMIVFGIVLIIYGLFRFVNTTYKVKQQKMSDKLEALKSERDKLFKGK